MGVDPVDPRRVFASTAWMVHRSEDGGRTWQETGGSFRAADFVFDPLNRDVVYATSALLSDGGLFRPALSFRRRPPPWTPTTWLSLPAFRHPAAVPIGPGRVVPAGEHERLGVAFDLPASAEGIHYWISLRRSCHPACSGVMKRRRVSVAVFRA